MKILETENRQLKLNIDVYGYVGEHYKNFKFQHVEKIELKKFSFINKINWDCNYGFLTIPHEEDHLIVGQESSAIEIEGIEIDLNDDSISFNFAINGDPRDIGGIATDYPFVVDINVTGCLKSISNWEQSLYSSYLMYEKNAISDSFIHLFIAFEGMIRSEVSSEESIHKIYKKYTNQELPTYLNDYREIRNTIAHGNESSITKLTIDDLEQMVDVIRKLGINYQPTINS